MGKGGIVATRVANADVVSGMRNVTLTVKLKRRNELAARIWIGKRLIALAAWVMNCNLQIEDE